MKKLKYLLILSFIFFSKPAFGEDKIGLDPGKQGDRGIKVSDLKNPEQTFGNVFNNILGLFFTIGALGFIIYFVWGAVDWILSGGDKEKIAGARKKIITAITGLVLLSLTFVAAIVIGQILNIQSLRQLKFDLPRLTN